MFVELLVLFRDDGRKNLLKAKAALAEKDLQALSRTAHTLKGMLRNLSMEAASDIASTLEQTAHKELLRESSELLNRLDTAMTGLLGQVEARLAGAQR